MPWAFWQGGESCFVFVSRRISFGEISSGQVDRGNRLLMLSLPVEEILHFVQDDVKGVGFLEQIMAANCESVR